MLRCGHDALSLTRQPLKLLAVSTEISQNLFPITYNSASGVRPGSEISGLHGFKRDHAQ